MAETQTWRVVLASGTVREVVVTRMPRTVSTRECWAVRNAFGDPRYCSSVASALSTATQGLDVREILAPGEPTRAELVAQLAVLRAQQAPLVACVDALRAAARAAGWRDADATGETLVAWVRRGERERCDDVIAARLVEAVRDVREKAYRGTGAERDTAAAVRDAIEAVRDMIREGGE